MFLEILVFLSLLVYFAWNRLFGTRPSNYPPGPIRFPIVGNLPLFGINPLETCKKWKQKYGPIIGLRFGEFNIVMLHDYEIIKAAFDKAEFSGRPSLGPILLIAGKEKRGLVASEGPHWSEQRRFALRNLRDFGFGKKSMEGVIQEDATELIETLKALKGTPTSTDRMLSLVALSALWHIVAGERLAHNDPKSTEILNTMKAVIGDTPISGPIFFMPWIAKIFPQWSGWNKFSSAIGKVKEFMSEKIVHHKAAFDKNNLRDFMDVYMNEIQNTTDPKSSFHADVGDENMLIGMLNLFGAGAETTANTLNWAFYFLAQNQKIQQKMQKQLDNVVGRNRLPGVDDKPNLPYVDAVMHETFRASTIIPFGIFHSTIANVTFKGYELPKNTAVMANVYDVHYNPDVWGDPEVFRPERFLSPDEKTFDLSGHHVIPFLVGKRSCLGETLARNEFYLLLSSIVQRFEIRFDPNTKLQDNSVFGIIRFPPKNKLIFKDRYD